MFPVSYMVHRFNVPIVMVVMVQMIVISLTASRQVWLLLLGVMHPPAGGSSCPRAEMLLFVVIVSVATRFSREGLLAPRLTLLLLQ